MPDTPIQFTGSILERFESKVAAEAPHLLPIVHAIRDHGVGFLVILMLLVTWNDIERYFIH